jgi:Trk K+ transport system NAD-binding subunit
LSGSGEQFARTGGRSAEVKRLQQTAAATPLINGVVYILVIMVLGTAGYVIAGWDLADAFYMVIITLFTVGYEEVHPVATPALRALTITLIVLGCTGMIYLTAAIVQFFNATQLQNLFGLKRMKNEIDHLKGHVIVCGFGRIGRLLARDLMAAGAGFVIIERDESRIAHARGMGYLCVQGEATEEQTLNEAGIARARVLATVLPDDAANVFITLSARSLKKEINIIARGEAPTTEGKLLHAGANQVVLPAHIGAERIVEMILYPDSSRMIRSAEQLQGFRHNLHNLGLNLVVVTVASNSRFSRMTVEEIEHQADGAFLIVALNRRDGTTVSRPDPNTRVLAGDGVVIVERSGRGGAQAVFMGDEPAA